MNTVSTGKKVSVEFTLRRDDQEVIFSNVGSDPLSYIHGSHRILRGLEEALDGMHIGETKRVVVPPEKGFGVAYPRNFRQVPKGQIPPESHRVGAQLETTDLDGRQGFTRVVEVNQDTVVLDFNHPLAGLTLNLHVKVLGIQESQR